MNSKTLSAKLLNDTDIIWHYTSMEVFTKMMFGETGLYATHVRFLNDSSEFRYGWQVIQSSEIVKKEEQISNNQLHDKLKQWEKTDVYVTCFSRDGDNLYQWRCYTPPQGGVSLGFSREELQQKIFGNDSTNLGTMGNTALKMFSFSSSTPSNTSEKDALGCLGSCLYYETEQNKAITDFISLEKKNHSLNAFFLACLMKHKSFEFEKEERIVYVGPSCFDKIEMIGNKPRIPLLGASKDESRQLIKGVIVAPHGDSEHNFYLTHLWARKYHLDWEPSFSCSTYVGG